MATKIFKYPIVIEAENEIDMPDGVVVHVGFDPKREPCVWVQHGDADGEKRTRRIFVVGTGHDIPQPAQHLGSYFDGPFVWHVFANGLEKSK